MKPVTSFEEARAERDEIEKEMSEAGAALQVFPRGAMGLTPDPIRATPEWRAAKARSDKAFRALQNFNSVFTKRFAKELRLERNKRYESRTRKHQVASSVPKNFQHLIAPGETTLDPRILGGVSEADDLRKRIARALGWTDAQARGFSLQALRDLVRPVDARLADEISGRVASGRVLF